MSQRQSQQQSAQANAQSQANSSTKPRREGEGRPNSSSHGNPTSLENWTPLSNVGNDSRRNSHANEAPTTVPSRSTPGNPIPHPQPWLFENPLGTPSMAAQAQLFVDVRAARAREQAYQTAQYQSYQQSGGNQQAYQQGQGTSAVYASNQQQAHNLAAYHQSNSVNGQHHSNQVPTRSTGRESNIPYLDHATLSGQPSNPPASHHHRTQG